LCDFLGLDVPDKPFPHENKNAEITEKFLKTHPVALQAKKELLLRTCCLSALVLFVVCGFRRNPSYLSDCVNGAVQSITQLKFW